MCWRCQAGGATWSALLQPATPGRSLRPLPLAAPPWPRFLDRRVLPGVNRLSWASPRHQVDFWHNDALRCCRDAAAVVAAVQAAGAGVRRTCAQFRDTLLLRVERKRLYGLPEFEQSQAALQVGRAGALRRHRGAGAECWLVG